MIVRFDETSSGAWDEFVLHNSMNGSFLQTRNFLNYHNPRKFLDHSLLFYDNQEIMAVLPANAGDSGTALLSHQGSTFGGLIVSPKYATLTNCMRILDELDAYTADNGIRRIVLKMPSWLYSRTDSHIEMLEYLLYLHGFRDRAEVGYFVDLKSLPDDFEHHYATLRRRKLKRATSANLQFKRLENEEEIAVFYDVLADNMKKFDTKPIHSCDELVDFFQNRLKDVVSFYGVYEQNKMIAGSMVFNFNNGKVFHTQYLASRHDSLELCPNEFLYTNLIREAKELQYRYLSFGTTTLEQGAVLNKSLALFKEGFCTQSYINRTYCRGE